MPFCKTALKVRNSRLRSPYEIDNSSERTSSITKLYKTRYKTQTFPLTTVYSNPIVPHPVGKRNIYIDK
uniref:Uncharacterized protein n=1 Tax=Pararge aegeria TaxID=116150 RepID=S4P1D1_9NEOP